MDSTSAHKNTNPARQKDASAVHSSTSRNEDAKGAVQLKDNRPKTTASRDLFRNQFIESGISSTNPIQKKANNTGLPTQLKSGIEQLSGLPLDDVRVHYNSDKPAQLQAHAYAQGSDIHLASGQERHLPHEAWHVVQQKQGRVKPTTQLKSSVAINDDQSLEKEADVMGAKAMRLNSSAPDIGKSNKAALQHSKNGPAQRMNNVIQRVIGNGSQLGDVVVSPSGSHWRIIGFKGPGVYHIKQLSGKPQLWNPAVIAGNKPGWNTLLNAPVVHMRRAPAPAASHVSPHHDVRVGSRSSLEAERAAKEAEDVGSEAAPVHEVAAKPAFNLAHELHQNGWYLDANTPLCVQHVMELTGNRFDQLHITTSGGSSVTIIPHGHPGVYQCFRDATYVHIIAMYTRMNELRRTLTPHVARVLRQFPRLNMLEFEKIIPLNALFDMFGFGSATKKSPAEFRLFIRKNANKIAFDISQAIHKLAAAGVVQGDVSLDNIGIKNGKFVLFDFDKASRATPEKVDKDNSDLFKSISQRGSIKLDKLGPTRGNIAKRLQAIAAGANEEEAGGKFIALQIKGLD